MRLTWLANSPWTPTGYGGQTALFGTRLTKAGHPIGVISNYGHAGEALNWNGLQVFGSSYHPFCMDIMHGHSRTFKADALLTMFDIQNMEPQMLLETKWIAWFPVDHVTINPYVFEKLKYSHARITMSKSANVEMDKTGMKYYYVPCGVDTGIFYPRDVAQSRIEMTLPLDKFIIGMVAMNKGNPSRKAFQQTIMAFAALKQKHPDVVLYLHTTDARGVEPVNLLALCKALSLKVGYVFQPNADADVIFADQYGMAGGYTPEMMAKLYSAMDVHCLVTMGEGFGIPLIEAQACGTPVITGDWTSMPELCFSGWKVQQSEAEPVFTPLEAWQFLAHPGAIAERMEAAYQMRGNPDYRERAIKGAKAYDADKIVEKYWLPALKGIQEDFANAPTLGDVFLKGLRR
jgi:glycosyltransferase involved in cell wall biosynthesis